MPIIWALFFYTLGTDNPYTLYPETPRKLVIFFHVLQILFGVVGQQMFCSNIVGQALREILKTDLFIYYQGIQLTFRKKAFSKILLYIQDRWWFKSTL